MLLPVNKDSSFYFELTTLNSLSVLVKANKIPNSPQALLSPETICYFVLTSPQFYHIDALPVKKDSSFYFELTTLNSLSVSLSCLCVLCWSLEEAMAVGLAITSEVGKYNGKMTPFVVLFCMIAATGGVIFGYDIGISGPFFLNFYIH